MTSLWTLDERDCRPESSNPGKTAVVNVNLTWPRPLQVPGCSEVF